MDTQIRKVELLAPAGSMETFYAGYRAGADAFYLGLGDFNARKRAKNFTRDDLETVTRFAHLHGKKIYVTMNTLLFDDEFPAVVDALSFLEGVRVDGVIVQDLGLLSILKEYFSSMAAHASTQMFCHNSRQAAYLKELGVQRIILARELTIDEIAVIMRDVPLEYEVFVHGAMCFSFSGCCLFSSYFFGDSGNRGRCRQPCRHVYDAGGGGKKIYPFSMRDLSAAELIPDLVALGVSAFKIEGRLKNAEYVHTAVSLYRGLIDGAAGAGDTGRIVSREQSAGYFRGWSYESLVQRHAPGIVGEPLGTVISIHGRECVFESDALLSRGARLRILDARGKKMHEGTLLDFSREGRARYRWKLDADVRARGGLRVYRTGESAAFTEAAALRRDAEKYRGVPVRVEVGAHGGLVDVRMEAADMDGISLSLPVPAERAITKRVESNRLREIFLQVDTYPFRVESLDVSVDDDVFIPLGEIKKIRREAYRRMYEAYTRAVLEKNLQRRNMILERLRHIQAESSSADIKSLAYEGADYAAETADYIAMDMEDMADLSALRRDTVIALPLFVSEGMLPRIEERLRRLYDAGFRRFMVPAGGWLRFFCDCDDVELFAGPMLYAANSFARELLRAQGVAHFVISGDMDDERVTGAGFNGRIRQLGARRDLMATRLRLPETCYRAKKRTLMVRRYEEYDVVYEES